MKNLIFITSILCFSFSSFFSQKKIAFPFPKIQLAQLPNLIKGDWKYSYSFNSDSTFYVDGSYIQKNYVPYRIEFKKTSKKQDKKAQKLSTFREKSCLNKFSFWVDEKGILRYPKLVSNKTDAKGNLLECKLELASSIDSDRNFITIQSVSNGVLVISNFQENKVNDMHVFVKELQ